ncbi:MAG: aminopeptidase [Polyangiaceae bacterium]
MTQLSEAVELEDVERAARVLITSCLTLSPGENLIVISDHAVPNVAEAIARVARNLGCRVIWFRLAEHGVRPFKLLPNALQSALAEAHASVFVASAPHNELGMRQHLLHLVKQHGVKHAHMPSISSLAFTRGLRLDYREVESAGRRVLDKLSGARALQVTSPAGTNLEVLLPPRARWFPQLGVLEPGRWGNLPAGALYTNPEHVSGRFVANASVGEFFGARHGLLQDTPVHLVLERGRVTRLTCPQAPELQRDIVRMLACSENSSRVGLICIGVNPSIPTATGEALVDQNLPGLHLSIGDPAAKVTGAGWSAPTAFAACQAFSSVLIEDVPLIERGQLLTPN